MRHGTPYAHSSKRPGDVDVSPLVPSLLAGLLRLRRLSLHTLVHGRLKPYKVQYLGSSGILDTARSEYTHTPYTTYYMNPYIHETRGVRFLGARHPGSPALLYTGFPKARNISPEQMCFPRCKSTCTQILEFRGFDTRARAFPKINLDGRFKFGRRALSSK